MFVSELFFAIHSLGPTCGRVLAMAAIKFWEPFQIHGSWAIHAFTQRTIDLTPVTMLLSSFAMLGMARFLRLRWIFATQREIDENDVFFEKSVNKISPQFGSFLTK